MKGRKPTAREIRLVRGNPGRRPMPPPLPEPVGGARLVELEPPASLTGPAAEEATRNGPVPQPHASIAAGAALQEWKLWTEHLSARQLLAEMDASWLVIYANAYGEYVDAQRQVTLTGKVVKSPNGYPIQNPWLAIRNKALEQCRAFWEQFGGSPSARTRIAAKVGGAGGANRTPRIAAFMAQRLKRAR